MCERNSDFSMKKGKETGSGSSSGEGASKPTMQEKREAVARSATVDGLKEEISGFLASVERCAELEVEESVSELRCLGRINELALEKVSNLANTVEEMKEFQEAMRTKHEQWKPVFEEIDVMHATVEDLEKVVDSLDAYSLRLEERARQVQEGRS